MARWRCGRLPLPGVLDRWAARSKWDAGHPGGARYFDEFDGEGLFSEQALHLVGDTRLRDGEAVDHFWAVAGDEPT